MVLPETSSIDQFEKEYPATLSARLGWLEKNLRLSRWRMLRLMGLSSQRAAAVGKSSWLLITKEYEFQADRVEHLLTHYLSFFAFDAKRARDFPKELSTKVEKGTYSLAAAIPAFVAAKTRDEKENALLAAIHEEDSSLLPALACFLAGTASNGSVRKHRPS